MIHFKPYPIFVLYSLNRQRAVERMSNDFQRTRNRAENSAIEGLKKLDLGRFLRQAEVYLDNQKLMDAAKQWQLMEDMDWKYKKEIEAYENEVKRLLTIISQTSIGSFVLKAISQNSKVWIIPALFTGAKAITDCSTESEGGGIRIHFDPKVFRRNVEAPTVIADTRESTLLHELVHAMRFSTGRFNRQPVPGPRQANFPDTEEFIATQIENIYRGSRKQNDLYDPYRGEVMMRKDKMYQWLADDEETLRLLKHFMDTEPVAAQAVALKQPDFNPFRDYAKIVARSGRK